jgi:hypothetical protein
MCVMIGIRLGSARGLVKNFVENWAPVAHACNPSYSGGRDQEVHSSKPAQANST